MSEGFDFQARSSAVKALRQLDAPPYGACIGDSITAANSNISDKTVAPVGSNVLKGAYGYLNWALALSGQRVRVPMTHCWGYPSQETAVVLTNLPALLALSPKPKFVIIEVGTNNISHADATTGTYAYITGQWQSMINLCMSAGVRVIFVPILPRSSLTVGQYDILDRCNRWLNRVAQLANGRVAVASNCLSAFANPISEGSQPTSIATYDGTHPAIPGAYYIGKALAEILRQWFPPLDLLPNNNLKYSASAPYANLLVNGMMKTGTTYGAGTISTPSSGTIAGTVPDQWTMSMSNTAGLTMTGAQATGASWGLYPGCAMHQLAFTGSYTVSGSSGGPTYAHFGRLLRNADQTGVQIGDTVEALTYVEIDSGGTGLSFPNLQMRWDGSTNWHADMHPSQRDVPADNIAMVLRTEPRTLAAVPTSGNFAILLYAYLNSFPDGSVTANATVRFGRSIVRKVEA